MQVVSRRQGARVADQGYRCPGYNLVSCLFQEFLVMLVYGDDIVAVLYLNRVSLVIAPSGIDDSAVQN